MITRSYRTAGATLMLAGLIDKHKRAYGPKHASKCFTCRRLVLKQMDYWLSNQRKLTQSELYAQLSRADISWRGIPAWVAA